MSDKEDWPSDHYEVASSLGCQCVWHLYYDGRTKIKADPLCRTHDPRITLPPPPLLIPERPQRPPVPVPPFPHPTLNLLENDSPGWFHHVARWLFPDWLWKWWIMRQMNKYLFNDPIPPVSGMPPRPRNPSNPGKH